MTISGLHLNAARQASPALQANSDLHENLYLHEDPDLHAHPDLHTVPTGAPISATDVCDREETTVAFVREMFTRLGEKWTMPVLDRLMDGPLRFTAIMSAVTGISHRVLTVTLRTLENDGMVTRTSYPESPPRVEYEVTALGGRFMAAALQMVVWAQDNRTDVLASRERALH